MAEKNKGKSRVQIKVIDIDSGEERFSSESIVVGRYCSYSCSCSNSIPVVDPRGPVETAE